MLAHVKEMNRQLILSFFILVTSSVIANERYTDNVYTGAVFSYWCTYKKVPTSKIEISKIENGHLLDTDIDRDLELEFDIWLDAVSYRINGNKLTLIKQSKVIASDKFQSTITSKSTANCDSNKRVNK